MDLGLNGKVALVTGASSGLGLAIARELAQEGAQAAMVARRQAELERQAAEISAGTAGRAVSIVGDVAEPDTAARVAREERALGPIDILVANAGGPPSTTFAGTTEDQYRPGVSPGHARQEVGPGNLPDVDGGKAAHSRSAALQYGHFDTARAAELARMRAEREGKDMAELLRLRTAEIPLGRAGDPKELAAVVAFLASNRATFLTGVALQVDGGQIQSLL